MNSLHGKVVLLTGAAGGFGKSISSVLLAQGCKLALLDIDEKHGRETAVELKQRHGDASCEFFKCDVTDAAEFEDCFKKTRSLFGRLDILINNAGVGMTPEWENMFAVNVNAVFRGIKLSFKYMGKEHGHNGGTVINVASQAGLYAANFMPAYAASESAVITMARAFGSDLQFNRHGVKVSCFCPGPLDTPMLARTLSLLKTRGDTADIRAEIQKQVINVEDAALGILQLLTDDKRGAVMEYTRNGGAKYHVFQD